MINIIYIKRNKEQLSYHRIIFMFILHLFPLNNRYNLFNLLAHSKFEMTNLENIKQVLENYSFRPQKPLYSRANYEIHDAIQKQTKLSVTIKILTNSNNPQLPKYLKRMKDCKSQNVIRIFEVANDSSKVVLVTENVGYGHLSNALSKCKRLQDSDAVSISKMILNGYVDLLRLDFDWKGTSQDIEFTDTGIKLSWNNSTNLKFGQSIAAIIEKISKREQTKEQIQNNLVSFPPNKIISQLIKVSKQSASEISLNPHFKKKQKFSKKKGKNWVAIKQITNKNQYIDESIYLAVSAQHGFIKVKIYDKGTVSPQLINLNKNKLNFTRVVDCYDEASKTIIVSLYSNDGSLQNYITKVKNAGKKLSQEAIQFFFFSLFQPIKQIQESPIKSIGMLHIKNIYLQDSIPKIGQPLPINQNLQRALIERQDVPDFYHPKFKKQPKLRSQIFDTYSLGVLLYKLMYTQYPIFPQGKVHIPTAPSYNKRLKNSLQILLNDGGTLKSLQGKIEVNQNVLKKVKQNKKKLQVSIQRMESKKSVELTKRALIQELQQTHFEQQQKQQQKSEQNHEQIDDDMSCFTLCCHSLQLTPMEKSKKKFMWVKSLEQSPYKVYRICTKIFLILCFYIFVYFFFFLKSNFEFMSNQSKLSIYNVKIATVEYPVIVGDVNTFETSYNKTARNVPALQGLNCLIDGYDGAPIYSDMTVKNSSGWVFYMICSLFSFIFFIVLKGFQNYLFDPIKVIYNWDHEVYNFNIWHYIIFNLQYSSMLHGHFYLFNIFFTGQSSPCLGSSYYYDSVYTLLNNTNKFLLPYMFTYIFQIVFVIIQWIMIWRTHEIKYNKIVNPIFFFCPLLIAEWTVVRIGLVKGYFQPNFLHNSSVFIGYLNNISYINIFGTFPELLWIFQVLLGLIVDAFYWCFLDKRRRLLIHDSSMASMQEVTR